MNYLLILMGISLLIIGIRCILQFVNTEIVYELPYCDDEGIFTIYNRGKYGLWLSGTLFKKSPLGDFGIEIVNQKTGEYIPLKRNLIHTSINGFKTSRMLLYTFQAEEGTYIISFTSTENFRDKITVLIKNMVSKKSVDNYSFSIQIRTHPSIYILTICFLSIILGVKLITSAIFLWIFS